MDSLTSGTEEGSHGESATAAEESLAARPGGISFVRTGRWAVSGSFMRTGCRFMRTRGGGFVHTDGGFEHTGAFRVWHTGAWIVSSHRSIRILKTGSDTYF
jgi:hypothetical protein